MVVVVVDDGPPYRLCPVIPPCQEHPTMRTRWCLAPGEALAPKPVVVGLY